MLFFLLFGVRMTGGFRYFLGLSAASRQRVVAESLCGYWFRFSRIFDPDGKNCYVGIRTEMLAHTVGDGTGETFDDALNMALAELKVYHDRLRLKRERNES